RTVLAYCSQDGQRSLHVSRQNRPTQHTFAVGSAGTPPLPTSLRQRIWPVVWQVTSSPPAPTARPLKRSSRAATRRGKATTGWAEFNRPPSCSSTGVGQGA